jgi:hypothetical protein
MKVDISLVSGRRPELLAETLMSFNNHVFRHFDVATVYANIDPFCGTDQDGDTCEAMIRDTFKTVEISRPDTASFGGAVKRLWSKPRTDIFFHMEDDWNMVEDLRPDRIASEFQGEVVQVQLSALARKKSPHRYNFPARWRKIMGIKVGKIYDLNRPLFTTSPSFVNTAFAARCAALMDPQKDPEKQLYSGTSELADFTRSFRSLTLQARDGGPLVVDLGRDWMADHNMVKEINDVYSQWKPLP